MAPKIKKRIKVNINKNKSDSDNIYSKLVINNKTCYIQLDIHMSKVYNKYGFYIGDYNKKLNQIELHIDLKLYPTILKIYKDPHFLFI